jgi:hypothetical protein
MGLKHNEGRVRVHANESLSFLCMSALLRLNGSRHWDNDALRRKLVATDRERSNQRIPFITKKEAQQFLSRFRKSNRLFFSKYVDPQLATEFADGFENFPDVIPEPSPSELLDFIFAQDPTGE